MALRPSEFLPTTEVRNFEEGSDINKVYPSQDFTKLIPIDEQELQPLFLPFDLNNIVAGTVRNIYCEAGIPGYWIVSIRSAATPVAVSVFLGPNATGTPFRLSGGGKLRAPANSEYLTVVVEAGSASVYGTVLAVRRYMNVDIDPGT